MNQPARQSTALANRPPADMVGSYTTANAINARLEAAADQAHLVSPMTSVGQIPQGWAVAITSVLVDIENETYPMTGGKKGLGKVALDRIAAAAGISWDAQQSGRIDDGSDPYYCHWKAVGHIRNFDGTTREIVGSKEMDLREGSPQIAALHDRARNGKSKDPTAQIREMRLHIMAHAESKARLRATRSIGIASGYSENDLRKPFIIAQLQLTGRVPGNPALEEALTLRLADAALAGRQTLYGNAPAAPRALEAPKSAPRLAPPPPVGSVAPDDDDNLPESWNKAPQTTHVEERPAQQQSRQREPGDDDDHVEPPQQQRASGFVIPGGQSKGTPIEDASDRDIDYWAGRISTSLDAGDSRNRERDQKLLDALRMEQEARR